MKFTLIIWIRSTLKWTSCGHFKSESAAFDAVNGMPGVKLGDYQVIPFGSPMPGPKYIKPAPPL